MATGLPKYKRPKSEEVSNAFYDLVSGVTHCHFYFILFTGNESLRPAYTQGGRDWALPFEEI